MLEPFITEEDIVDYLDNYEGKTKQGVKYKKQCQVEGCSNYIEVLDKSFGWRNGKHIIVKCDEHEN